MPEFGDLLLSDRGINPGVVALYIGRDAVEMDTLVILWRRSRFIGNVGDMVITQLTGSAWVPYGPDTTLPEGFTFPTLIKR